MPIRQLLHDSGVLEVVLDIPPGNAVDHAPRNRGSTAASGVRSRELHRQELSYTYELNLLGDAAEARARQGDGSRAGHLSPK